MDKHHISELMETTMQKMRELVDVNTVVGSPIQTQDGITIIPVSKLSFGFISGGSDFATKNSQTDSKLQFGGGSGAGVTINPLGFLTVGGGDVKFVAMSMPPANSFERVIELVPDMISKVSEMFVKNKEPKAEE